MRRVIHGLGRLACFIWLCFGMVAGASAASETGMVMNMDGTMTARGTDGELREMKIFSKVLLGDTLFMGRDSYARVKFADGGQISLQPGSQLRVETYHFNAQEPDKDNAGFNLLKGGLRAISGLIGKRGDPDSYGVKAETATVGIRGTHFGVLICKNNCTDLRTADGKPPEDGLHVDVAEGSVVLRNAGRTQLLNAGQFAYVRDINTPPVIIPAERSMKVTIPARISLDRVRGKSGDEKGGEGKADGNGADDKGADSETPGSKGEASGENVCPI